MLVLTRKINESIVIGDDVIITVLPGGKVDQYRTGINAPKHVRVDREEVRKRRLAGFCGGSKQESDHHIL